jgi:integrase
LDENSTSAVTAIQGYAPARQLLLGHSSVQTTERYLGTKQDLAHAPNDAIKLKLAG